MKKSLNIAPTLSSQGRKFIIQSISCASLFQEDDPPEEGVTRRMGIMAKVSKGSNMCPNRLERILAAFERILTGKKALESAHQDFSNAFVAVKIR